MDRFLSSDYDAIFDRVEIAFSLFLTNGHPVQEPPGILLAELAPLSSDEEEVSTAAHGPRMALPLLTRWLIARSHAVRHEDPDEMLHWALMARLAVDSCSAVVAGSTARLADLRARAWGQLGNALRVCGRLGEAGDLMEAARVASSEGTGDLALLAQLFSWRGSLQIAREDFHDAIEIAEESALIYEEICDEEGLASSLLLQATAVHYIGEPDRAIYLIGQAMKLLQRTESPELLLGARLNRARFSIEIDPSERALSSFLTVKRQRLAQRCSTLLLRATWQEGQMLAEIGSLDLSAAALLQAREGYIERALAQEVLAVSRDLVSLYKRQEDWLRLEQMLLSTREVLSRGRLESEMLSSLRDFEQTPSLKT